VSGRQQLDAGDDSRDRSPLALTAHRIAAFPDPVEGELMPAHRNEPHCPVVLFSQPSTAAGCSSAMRDHPSAAMSAWMISGGAARKSGSRAMAALKWLELT
jgi:hypothetical protein